MTEAEREARKILKELVREGGQYNPDWTQLRDALGGALRGEASAAATLLRVFNEPGFAGSNSCHEQGYAALGLALLGVREARPQIERAMRINLNARAIPLALELLA
jgi:hypothetical protein